jgi:hypothetical protein
MAGRQGKLKATFDDATHSDVFVDLFPAQGNAGDPQGNRSQFDLEPGRNT